MLPLKYINIIQKKTCLYLLAIELSFKKHVYMPD